MIDPNSIDPDDAIIPEDDPDKTIEIEHPIDLNETIDVSDHDADAGTSGSVDDPEEDEYGTIDPEDNVKPIQPVEEVPSDPWETWEEEDV